MIGLRLSESPEGFVRSKQTLVLQWCGDFDEFHPVHFAAAFGGEVCLGPVHEDSPHGHRGGAHKVRAVLPFRRYIGQFQPGFVDEGRRIECLPRRLRRKLRRREPAEFVVNLRQEIAVRHFFSRGGGADSL